MKVSIRCKCMLKWNIVFSKLNGTSSVNQEYSDQRRSGREQEKAEALIRGKVADSFHQYILNCRRRSIHSFTQQSLNSLRNRCLLLNRSKNRRLLSWEEEQTQRESSVPGKSFRKDSREDSLIARRILTLFWNAFSVMSERWSIGSISVE